MCGIAGILDGGSSFFEAGEGEFEALVRRMADAITHRGPDASGSWIDRDHGIALAHRRLSIVDLSEAGAQPMVSSCGRYVITYNGELYNAPALRKRLEEDGYSFRGHCDTEVLLAAIQAWGLRSALGEIAGMFAFGLWDRANETLSLVRDRLGKKPLYYRTPGLAGSQDRRFAFASELSALAADPTFDPPIDRDAVGHLVRYGWIAGPRSIFEGVKKVPAGAIVEVSNSAIGEAEVYWSAVEQSCAAIAAPYVGSFEDAVDGLDRLLGDAIDGRTLADVPLGALLSGGIDSTLIVAMLSERLDAPVRTFTIGFDDARFNEAEHAKALAKHLGTEHTELYVTWEHALDLIPQMPKIYSEPFADPSQLPTYLVSALAREDVTVVLTGDGGDEMFAGYGRYLRALRNWRRSGGLSNGLRRTSAKALRAASEAGWDLLGGGGRTADSIRSNPLPKWRRFPGKFEKRARQISGDSPLELLASGMSHISDPARLVLGTSSDCAMPTGPFEGVISDPLKSMLAMDTTHYLADDILVKVDRASMAMGLEVRSPFLDHRVLDYAWSLPNDYLISGTSGKRVLQELLGRYVPKALTDRPKQGFGVPIEAWLRGPLFDWAEDLLSADALVSEGVLDPVGVRRVWGQHLSGWRNRDTLLWSILMFRAWHDAWRDRPRSAGAA